MPFYFWTRYLARQLSDARAQLGPILGQGFGLAAFKTVVTQARHEKYYVGMTKGEVTSKEHVSIS